MKTRKVLFIIAFTVSFTSCTKDKVINQDENFSIDNEPEIGTMIDIEGNIYYTTKIGNQWWMKENLKCTKYNDGTTISNIESGAEWVKSIEGAYCNYKNEASYIDTFGLLYNYYSIESEKLCPDGWRIPTIDDWEILLNYTDSVLQITNECDALRSYTGWRDAFSGESANGLDLVGFKALPSGYRALVTADSVNFWGKESWTMFWSSTNSGNKDSTHIYTLNLSPSNPSIIDEGLYNRSALPKNYGISIRLIKD